MFVFARLNVYFLTYSVRKKDRRFPPCNHTTRRSNPYVCSLGWCYVFRMRGLMTGVGIFVCGGIFFSQTYIIYVYSTFFRPWWAHLGFGGGQFFNLFNIFADISIVWGCDGPNLYIHNTFVKKTRVLTCFGKYLRLPSQPQNHSPEFIALVKVTNFGHHFPSHSKFASESSGFRLQSPIIEKIHEWVKREGEHDPRRAVATGVLSPPPTGHQSPPPPLFCSHQGFAYPAICNLFDVHIWAQTDWDLRVPISFQ